MLAAVEHSVFSAGKSTNSSTISHSSQVTGSQLSLVSCWHLGTFLRWGTLYGTFLHFFCWKSLYSALQALSLPLPEAGLHSTQAVASHLMSVTSLQTSSVLVTQLASTLPPPQHLSSFL